MKMERPIGGNGGGQVMKNGAGQKGTLYGHYPELTYEEGFT
jgi:hypothetical protein